MSVKLRELIRNVRACKTAAEERSVITKELAAIRTAFKQTNSDERENRHRNIAKLLYVEMLGYPTHFAQMEVVKLLASPLFPEKRLGYLALMQLLDENAEVLMLATQALKNDMANENPFIIGLALCAFGNIASGDMARDLASELEHIMKSNNPYIRKKGLCTAVRVVQRAPEIMPDYFKLAVQTLEDTTQGNAALIGAVQLLNEICIQNSKLCKKMRQYIPSILTRLNSLLRSTYDPDHDIGGVTDPFLQVHLLNLLRTITHTDKSMTEQVMDTLTQIATNTESNKNPGNSVLYECVRTTMCIETQSPVHRLAVNILGKFLLNRDNNIRYVALNALCNAVTTNNDAIQRHRNQIKECLKDADITIRTRALDLIYALTNEENIADLVQDLLKYCDMSSNEPEFQQDLAAKICMVVERYAPDPRWHIDTVTQVMAKVGSLVMEEAITSLYVLIARTPELQMYATFKLFGMVTEEDNKSDPLRRLCAWCIGEYGQRLITNEGAKAACIDTKLTYKPYSEEQVLNCFQKIMESDTSTEVTKAFVLTALLKLSSKFERETSKQVIVTLLKKYNDSIAVELQQRSVEFTELLNKATTTIKQEVLKAMPAPQVNRFEETKGKTKESKKIEEVSSEDEKEEAQPEKRQNQAEGSEEESTGSEESEETTNRKKKGKNTKKKETNSTKSKKSGKEETSSEKNKSSSQISQPSRQNQGPDLLTFDLMSGASLITSSQESTQKTNLLDDILSLGSIPTTTTTTTNGTTVSNNNNNITTIPNFTQINSTPSTSEIAPIVAFNKNGIEIMFYFAKSNQAGVVLVNSVFRNANAYIINDFSFMVAVPKYLTLDIQPSTGKQLLGLGQNQQSQKFKLTNHFHGQKPLVIRIQISYTDGSGNKVVEVAQVTNFPANC